MATWHQQQRPIRLYHETDWTIVTDPPGELTTLWRCASKEEAEHRLNTWKTNGKGQHSYILAPANPKR